MSNELKLAPGVWHPISAINDSNRYAPSYLLHCPDLICSDFNPSGVVEGHWCDDEGWQAAVWCGYHDEFHTKFVTPTLVMMIPSIADPQPPALGGELNEEISGLISIMRNAVRDDANDGGREYHQKAKVAEENLRSRLAPLQTEIQAVKFNLDKTDRLYLAAVAENEQLKAQRDAMAHALTHVRHCLDDDLPEDIDYRLVRTALETSKPAASDQP
ncbi:hypothetical protein ACTACG_07140 [Pseudomonas syringae]|uniref:hypothetical protein n=1 Tax=Pseudomonas syringae TaxID=317 RepID=UPI003F754B54